MEKKNRLPLQSELGMIPPQAVDFEEAILGAAMLEPNGAYLATRILSPSHFYKESHQKIFQAISQLNNRQEPIDILTVTAELRKMTELEIVGGAFYISKLTNRVASSANIEFHCRIVQEKFLRREQIRISSEAIRTAYGEDGDTFDALEFQQQSLHNLTKGLSNAKAKTTEEVIDQLGEIMNKNDEGVLTGIPTGFKIYDSVSGGHQKGHLVIYAARPSMGKTARMINEIWFQLKQGFKIVIHSLEMTPVELLSRLAGLEFDTPPEYIMKRKLDQELQDKITAYLKKVSEQLTIFEFQNLTDIERETALLVREGKCDIAYLDYLQLAKAGLKDPMKDLEEVSKGLKSAAKRLEIPFVCIAQLSRAVETRGGDRRPILSDLRGSGQIEQDADVVDFLYRPEYYDIDCYEDGQSTAGLMEFINGKMRGGRPKETIKMKWNGPLNKISDEEPEPFSPSLSNYDFSKAFDDEEPLF